MPIGLEDTERNAGLRNNNQEHDVSDVTEVVLFTHKFMRFDASFLLSYFLFILDVFYCHASSSMQPGTSRDWTPSK